jgi:hypothetical protein
LADAIKISARRAGLAFAHRKEHPPQRIAGFERLKIKPIVLSLLLTDHQDLYRTARSDSFSALLMQARFIQISAW